MGNQMFQYAAGKSIALRHGMELKVDTSILEDHSPGTHDVNRNYDLDLFRLEVKKASVAERFRYNSHALPLPLKISRKALSFLSKSKILQERISSVNSSFESLSDPPAYISGSWQSYNYFKNIDSELRMDFRLKAPLLPISLDIEGKLLSTPSVCLHVRRTDYVNVNSSSEVLGFVGLDYYRTAVQRLITEVGNDLTFFVFSDDLDWCRQEMRWLPNDAVLVGHDHVGYKVGNYFALMSRCKYFIIPNSTFSWWAAWLSADRQKRVIIPQKWFRDQAQSSSGLCLPDWISV